MFALTVNVDEQGANLCQDRYRCWSTVQSGAATSPSVDLTTENQLTFALVDLEFFKHLGESVTVRHAVQIKCRVDGGRSGSRPYHVGTDPVSEDRPESVNEDRFTGAGFSGQDIQPGTERNLDGLDDSEITDREFDEHGLESLLIDLESVPLQQ